MEEVQEYGVADVLGQIDLVALILACVPMSKDKLSLQLVNKTWKKAVESPAAHSLKTEDCNLPFAGQGMSRKVTRVLSWCQSRSSGFVEADWNCEDWLGPDLQELALVFYRVRAPMHVFESSPVMPRLGHLELFFENAGDLCYYDLSQKCPNLMVLKWGTIFGGIPSHLGRLTELTRFEFRMRAAFDYNPSKASVEFGALPKACEIVFSILDELLPIPLEIVGYVTSIVVIMLPNEEPWSTNVWQDEMLIFDFEDVVWSCLSKASNLTSFELKCERAVVLRNVGCLLLSCRKLDIYCTDLQLSLADVVNSGFWFQEISHKEGSVMKWVLTRS